MATVTGFTAARMAEIEAACIVDGAVVLDDLILTRHDGTDINAGNVRGAAGAVGPAGPAGPQGAQGVQGIQGVQGPPAFVAAVDVLPSSPSAGQTCIFQTAAMAAMSPPVRWFLSYDGTKWVPIGGPSLRDDQLANETGAAIASSTYGGVNANDPAITIPVVGDYRVEQWCAIMTAQNVSVSCGIKVGATEPIMNTNAPVSFLGTGGAAQVLGQDRLITGLAAGTVLQQRYWHNYGSALAVTRGQASLVVTPIRIG